MLSALIRSEHSYPAVPLARQQVDQRFVHFGPLVLETNPLKYQRLQQIGDQPVSRFDFRISLYGMDYMIIFLSRGKMDDV